VRVIKRSSGAFVGGGENCYRRPRIVQCAFRRCSQVEDRGGVIPRLSQSLE